jgi:hypothetical protein
VIEFADFYYTLANSLQRRLLESEQWLLKWVMTLEFSHLDLEPPRMLLEISDTVISKLKNQRDLKLVTEGVPEGKLLNWLIKDVHDHDVVRMIFIKVRLILCVITPTETTIKKASDFNLLDIYHGQIIVRNCNTGSASKSSSRFIIV